MQSAKVINVTKPLNIVCNILQNMKLSRVRGHFVYSLEYFFRRVRSLGAVLSRISEKIDLWFLSFHIVDDSEFPNTLCVL